MTHLMRGFAIPEARLPRAMFRLALVAVGLPLLSSMAAADSLPEPRQVGAHSYAWIGPYGPPTAHNAGFRMNLGFVVGSEAVAVIDSGYGDAMAGEMLAAIRRVTDRPVRYAINTNSQPHRILGNARLRQSGAAILAAAGALERIVEQGPAMAGMAESLLGVAPGSIDAPGAPTRVLNEAVRLDLGNVELNVVPVGTAHTAGSLVVEVVDDGVVYAGDVLYGGRALALLPVSRLERWIDAFDALGVFGDARFIPGHGEPGALSDFKHPTRDYLTALMTYMDDALERGLLLDEAVDGFDQSGWSHLEDHDALARRNAYQAYLERETAAFE